MNLKKYALCYFDVLGTTSRIKNDGIDDALNNLWNIIIELNQNIFYRLENNKMIPDPQPVVIKAFTDNFLIAKEIETIPFEAINPVFMAVGRAIYRSLFHDRILLRGACVVGEMHIDDDVVLGPAIIDAHHIEENVAIFPRIVVDQTVLNAIPGAKANRRDFNGYFFEDYDGVICFNYLRFVIPNYVKSETPHLIELLKEDRDKLPLKEQVKYNWIINYLDEYYHQLINKKILF